MARSHHRPKKHHPQQQHATARKQPRKAAPIMSVFIGLFGLGMGYFASGLTPSALIIGAILGGLVGYLIGHGMDKASREK